MVWLIGRNHILCENGAYDCDMASARGGSVYRACMLCFSQPRPIRLPRAKDNPYTMVILRAYIIFRRQVCPKKRKKIMHQEKLSELRTNREWLRAFFIVCMIAHPTTTESTTNKKGYMYLFPSRSAVVFALVKQQWPIVSVLVATSDSLTNAPHVTFFSWAFSSHSGR